jgi:hypothetical protein
MREPVYILVDDSPWSQNAQRGLVLPAEYEAQPVCLDHHQLEANANQVATLRGYAINLLSPQTFSLYRGKLYQLLSHNRELKPFLNPPRNYEVKLHRWAWVSEAVEMGAGSSLGLSSFVGTHARIGPHTTIGNFSWIGEGAVIGAGVEIGNHVTIHAGVQIGSGSQIGRFNEIRRHKPCNTLLNGKTVELDFYGATAHFYGVP